MKKLLKKFSRKKRECNYLAAYVLLLPVVQQFQRRRIAEALAILLSLSIAMLCDICFSKDRDNAIANWLLFYTVAGCVLIWCLFFTHELIYAVGCIPIVCMLLVVLVRHWKRALSPKEEEPPQSEQ